MIIPSRRATKKSEPRFVYEQPILRSQCSRSQKLRLLNQLTNLWHRDRLWSSLKFPDFDVLDAMIASALQKLHAVKCSEKGKCRRAASSDFRPNLTRKTNCVHDLWVFPCNQCVWSSTRAWRLVHYEFAEWRRPRFRCKMGSSTINRKRNCTSQNYRILFNFRLWWPWMIKKLHETMEHRTINN